MAYEKQTFVKKQVLKADHLNHIESGIETIENSKQDVLIDGQTIKTINGQSLLGSGNISISGGSGSGDGVGVQSVVQTTTSTTDGGTNIITVTLTDGTKSTFQVKNGSKGSKGTNGYTPVKGTDYWTNADKNEIKSYVDEAILNGEW